MMIDGQLVCSNIIKHTYNVYVMCRFIECSGYGIGQMNCVCTYWVS